MLSQPVCRRTWKDPWAVMIHVRSLDDLPQADVKEASGRSIGGVCVCGYGDSSGAVL